MSEKPQFFRSAAFGIAYFAAGILFIGITKALDVSFWVRFPVLVLWAIGLAFVFIKALEKRKKQ
jgi:hypothetical protein